MAFTTDGFQDASKVVDTQGKCPIGKVFGKVQFTLALNRLSRGEPQDDDGWPRSMDRLVWHTRFTDGEVVLRVGS